MLPVVVGGGGGDAFLILLNLLDCSPSLLLFICWGRVFVTGKKSLAPAWRKKQMRCYFLHVARDF